MICGGDVESDWTEEQDKTWVAQWSIWTDERSYHDSDPDKYAERLVILARQHKNVKIAHHNLKFDSSLLARSIVDIFSSIGAVFSVIARFGSPISIKASWTDYVKSRTNEGEMKNIDRSVEWIDTVKKLPGTDLATVGKMLGLPKLDSVSDWYAGWSKDIDMANEQAWKYVDRDAEICGKALKWLYSIGCKKNTLAGDAWADLKDCYHYKDFAYNFPEMPRADNDDLRQAAYGAINLSQPGKYENVYHYDFKSSYPSICVGSGGERLPYGKFEVVGENDLEDDDIFVITNLYYMLDAKQGSIPWYRFKKAWECEEEGIKLSHPVIKTKVWHMGSFSNVDLEELDKDYHCKFETGPMTKIYRFKGKIGLFADYMNKWFTLKDSRDDSVEGRGLYAHDKYMLNGLTGVLAQGLRFQDWEFTSTGLVDMGMCEPMEVSKKYLPGYIFITAYGRRKLLEAFRSAGRKNAIHGDTDSVISKVPLEGDFVHKGLGGLRLESEPQVIWERGYKRYIEQINGFPKVVCAGIPKGIRGPAIELIDNPDLFIDPKTSILGQKDYKVENHWLANIVGRCVDTRRLISRKVDGGYVLKKESVDISAEPYVWKLVTNMEDREDVGGVL